MAKACISIIGDGSYNWSPIILRDIAAMQDLVGTVIPYDINPVVLEEMQQLGRKIMAVTGADFAIEASTDLAQSLRDAEFYRSDHP